MEDLSEIKYVKLNTVHLMKGKREKNTKLLKEFFEKIDRRVKGMKGYAIMESQGDPQETIVVTFWETKEDMDMYYRPDNSVLSEFILRAKFNFEKAPERKDYVVSKLDIY
jgi:quinol monooxygenase YgiN